MSAASSGEFSRTCVFPYVFSSMVYGLCTSSARTCYAHVTHGEDSRHEAEGERRRDGRATNSERACERESEARALFWVMAHGSALVRQHRPGGLNTVYGPR